MKGGGREGDFEVVDQVEEWRDQTEVRKTGVSEEMWYVMCVKYANEGVREVMDT